MGSCWLWLKRIDSSARSVTSLISSEMDTSVFSSALFVPNSIRLLYFICSADHVYSITHYCATDFEPQIESTCHVSIKAEIQDTDAHLSFMVEMNVRFSLEDLKIFNRDEDAVQLPDGSGYAGSLNVYHEIHCVVSPPLLPDVTSLELLDSLT